MNATNRKYSSKKGTQTQQSDTLIAPLKKAYDRFLKIRGNPNEIAWGLAGGLMVGMTPLLGLHTIMALFFAALFKWNKISTVIGVYITNPFTAPLIYPLTYYVGAKILGNSGSSELHVGEGFTGFIQFLLKTPDIFWKMFLGGFILGLPLAIIGYYISYNILVKYHEEIKRKLAESKEKRALKREIRKHRKNKKKQRRPR